MDELNEIIETVSFHMDVRRCDILNTKIRRAALARGMVCDIIKNFCPYLKKLFIQKSTLTSDTFTYYYSLSEKALNDTSAYVKIMNRVRRSLQLPVIKTHDEVVLPSITKRIFGFDYTHKQKAKFILAITNAQSYMDKISSIGRQPIEDGMVFSLAPVRKLERRNWYLD